LEDLLDMVGLEVRVEGVRAGTHRGTGEREFQIAGAATLKLHAQNELIYGQTG